MIEARRSHLFRGSFALTALAAAALLGFLARGLVPGPAAVRDTSTSSSSALRAAPAQARGSASESDASLPLAETDTRQALLPESEILDPQARLQAYVETALTRIEEEDLQHFREDAGKWTLQSGAWVSEPDPTDPSVNPLGKRITPADSAVVLGISKSYAAKLDELGSKYAEELQAALADDYEQGRYELTPRSELDAGRAVQASAPEKSGESAHGTYSRLVMGFMDGYVLRSSFDSRQHPELERTRAEIDRTKLERQREVRAYIDALP